MSETGSNGEEEEKSRNYRPGSNPAVGWKAREPVEEESFESDSSEPPGRLLSRAILSLCLGGVALIAAALIFAFQNNGDSNPELDKPVSRILDERAMAKASRETVSSFYAANSVEDRLPFVCDPERVEPLMRDHYRRFPIEVREVEKVDLMTSSTRYDTKHRHTLCSVIDAEKKVSVAILREYPDKVSIDWEALVAYNALSLRDIITLQPAEPLEIRVMLNRSDYYNYGYDDDGTWQAFYMVNPNEEGTTLTGYAKRDSPVFSELMTLTRAGHRAALRLEIQCTAEPGQNVATILRIAAPHWLGDGA